MVQGIFWKCYDVDITRQGQFYQEHGNNIGECEKPKSSSPLTIGREPPTIASNVGYIGRFPYHHSIYSLISIAN
jgi:hypothetical protein